ncbi:putative MFS-type transporter C09D4.1 [Styela clava]
MDIVNVHAALLTENKIKLHGIRWFVGFLLIVCGFLVMFAWHFFGVINEVLSEYFQVSESTTDWLTMSAAIGGIFGGPIIGFLFVLRPTVVKMWYIVMILTTVSAFVIFAIVIYIKKYLILCMIAEFAVGTITMVFFALLPLTATVWFGEREQATVLGIGWLSMMIAVLVASFVPMAIFSENENIENEMTHLSLLFLSFAAVGIICLGCVCLFVPNAPKIPPSYAELQRLKIAAGNNNETCATALWRFAKEVKLILVDRVSATLFVIFAVVDAVFVAEYMLAPASSRILEYQNSTNPVRPHETSESRGNVLLSYSAGGLIGCVGMGFLADKMKAYNPIANILGISMCVSVTASLLGYIYRVKPLEYTSNFLYGLITLAFYPFMQEIIKQHVYPSVQESTQGIFVAFIGGVLCVVIPYLMRTAMTKFAKVAFYAISVSIFVIIEILIIGIKPTMKRFIYDSNEANSADNEQNHDENAD